LTTTHLFLLYFVLGCELILLLVTDLQRRDKEPVKYRNTKQTSFNITATCLNYISIYSANDMDDINKADHSEIPILGNLKSVTDTKVTEKSDYVKRATSRFAYIEKFRLNVSGSSFAIRVNLLHP